jgi:hypothetical protein
MSLSNKAACLDLTLSEKDIKMMILLTNLYLDAIVTGTFPDQVENINATLKNKDVCGVNTYNVEAWVVQTTQYCRQLH